MKFAIAIFAIWLAYGAAYCLVAGDVATNPPDEQIYACPQAIDQQLNDERLISEILDRIHVLELLDSITTQQLLEGLSQCGPEN